MKKRFMMGIMVFLLLLSSATLFAAPMDKPVTIGMRGDEVVVVQKLLAEVGFYAGPMDGIFGGGTFRAVQEFQKSNGLPADGVVSYQTHQYLERSTVAPSRYSRELTMKASAYTSSDPGNGSYTSRGNLLRKGLVAVDPGVIPLGSRLFIQGYGYAIADDIGGAIKGNRIDLAFESRSDALQFGVQKVVVYVLD